MKREYHKWYSPTLHKNMELLLFGHAGAKVLFFPPRMGRFYDYENWGVIKSLEEKINAGHLQVYCVDSIDTETFYNKQNHPEHRIYRHVQYENYILKEVIPLMNVLNNDPNIIVAGCSLGAYHAVNIAMRHPNLFCKVVGMSGRYDLTISKSYFDDLMTGFHNDTVYFNMPNQYLKNLRDTTLIQNIAKLDIILVIGKEDLFLESNYKLAAIFDEKQIPYQIYQWDGEAHKTFSWKKMVQIYF